jgi:hypothetical protein
MTQPRFFTFSQAQGTPHAHADYRPAPRYHHTTNTPAETHTIQQHHPPQRRVTIMARVTPKQRTPTSHTRHIAHSHAAYKHASPARPHDVPHSTNHCTLPKHHCTHTAARTSHTERHTAPTTRHAAHKHPVTHAASAPHSRQRRQASQRRRDAAGELVAVQVQPPAGHTNSHRVTPWHPTPPPTPASRPQRIAAHHIASIESSRMKASQHTACYRSRTTPCASDPQDDTTRQHRYLTPSSHSTTYWHCDGRARHNATHSEHTRTSARHTTATSQQHHSNCKQRVNAASAAHADQQHDDA